MFENHCRPRLARLVPPLVIRTRQFRVAGLGESDLDQLIAPVYKQYDNPVTTVLAAPGDVQIHLRARCETEEEAERLLGEVGPQIEALLGDRIYSRNGDPLEAVVGRLLSERGESLAVAESCTGGMIAARITQVPGSSAYFAGGFVVYAADLKVKLLGLDPALIERHTVVSEEVARAMALAARDRTGAAYALATTGEAGPDSATGAPPGTIYVALAAPSGVTSKKLRFSGDRDRIRQLTVQTALDHLRHILTEARAASEQGAP